MISKARTISISSIATIAAVTAIVFFVGTGSGSLIIDGSTTKYNPGDTIKIKSGKYTSITIQNLNGTDSLPIVILNSGLVEITGNSSSMNLVNVNNITISGNGTLGITQGFYLHDNSGRSLQFSGAVHNVRFQYALFKNIGDYAISSDFGNTVYKSTDPTTYWSNIYLLNLEFNNTGQINLDGDVKNGQLLGVVKGLEIGSCYFHDASPGDYAWIGMADSYTIHDNIATRLNTTNNNHNGIFHVQGNGQFYNNKFTNIQGNSLRAWTVSVGTTPKQVLIYNNITDSTRKYSGYEVQSFSSLIVSGKTTYANATLSNNTVGDLDWSKDNAISAGLVDAYALFGGSLTTTKNLLFNTFPANTIINQEANVPITSTGNIYQPTWKSAVTDLTTFKSLFPGVGSALNGIITPPPIPVDTTNNKPPITIHDTIRVHDTVSVLGRAAGKYTLTVNKDTITLQKQ